MASGITLRTALRQRWLWSFVGAAAMWLVIAVAANGHGAGETLSVALAFATFYVIVGIGEMLVITTGPGNIDLSIPSVMTLAGYLSIGAMGADDKRILIGFAVALGAGLIAGVVNVALIRLARIPPMIATLATGFIMQSMAIAYSSGSTTKPAPLLVMLSSARLLGVPVLALIFIAVAALVAFVLARTALGRSISAIGQNRRAAYLAGLSVESTSICVYLVSSTLAGLAGLLLASYSGGASLDMSSDFLLMTIAVVVIGGTSIAGGRASVAGIWGASLFLYLAVAMLNILGVSVGVRYVVTGVIIIMVLALSEAGERA